VAGSPPSPRVTILRFDSHKVTKIKQFTAEGLKLDIDRDKMVLVYQIYEGQWLNGSKE